jgi:hypothetical protein
MVSVEQVVGRVRVHRKPIGEAQAADGGERAVAAVRDLVADEARAPHVPGEEGGVAAHAREEAGGELAVLRAVQQDGAAAVDGPVSGGGDFVGLHEAEGRVKGRRGGAMQRNEQRAC